MATKSGQPEPEKAEVVEELLETLDGSLDRVKVLYEQYFLGIQKQPPTYLHTEVERKIRDIIQLQIRNTALRYRFATLQQKFGSYNAYWRRTLRQIENGTYTRNLSKIGRHAAKTGAAVPEEILAAMPKRMRDQITRDRQAALALAELRNHHADDPEFLTLVDDGGDDDLGLDDQGPAAFVRESAELRRSVMAAGGTHKIDEADADFDLDAFFAKVMSEGDPSLEPPARESPTGSGPVAQPPALLDAPAIRWRTLVPKVEPRPALEPRSGAQVPGHPGPGPAPGREPPSTGQPGAGRPFAFKPNAAPPTVRLRSPGFGRPITANPGREGPDTERIIKRPITEPPTGGPPSSGAGQLPAEAPSARPPSAVPPGTVRSSTGPLNTGAPTVRLGRPGFGRPITEPPTAPPPSAVPPSVTPSSAAPPGALPLTGRTPSTAPPTVRLRSPGAGRMTTVRGIEPSSPDEPQPPAEPPSLTKPSGEPPRTSEGPPPAGPPSAGAGQPPGPPIGIRPIIPSLIPPLRGTSTPASSRPLPSQLVRPNPSPPPTPAPSQATRPLPITPGAAATLAPSTVETLAGPFPRIPSPPTFPGKPRAASEASAAEERSASAERTASAQAQDRTAPSRPVPNKP